MSEVIEPTNIIGPDGTIRTGWELPRPFYDFDRSEQAMNFRIRSAFAGTLIDPASICRVTGTWT